MFNAIGAHIYAGGFTVGVSQYFNVLGHLEHAAYGKEVMNLNFPGLPIYDGGPAAWPDKWPRGGARPRFLYANPPCAIWSGASNGRAGRWQDDPRLQAHHDIFGYGLDLEVDVMAIESVSAVFTRGREHVDQLVTQAGERGYSTTIVAHDAQYMGVAQVRKRIFLVFHRVAIPWQPPSFDSVTTVRQALRGIKGKSKGYDTTMPPGLLRLAEGVGPGGRLKTVYNDLYPDPPLNERGHAIGRPSFLDARAPWDRPANVVIAGKMIHPDQPRYMNQEELAAICSFPPTYLWPKQNFHDVSGYMSRGVMPRVGAWLAENVNRAIEDGKRLNRADAEVYDVARLPVKRYALIAAPAYEETEMRLTPPVIKTIAAASRPRALVTGSTPIQVGSTKTQLQIITAAAAWQHALTDLGYDVEWRAVTPGEDVSGYDVVIVVLNKPNSISSHNVHGALWTLVNAPRSIIALDDWQTKGLLSGLQSCARSRERLFRLRNTDIDDGVKDQIFAMTNELANTPWRWPVIAPVLGRGNINLLELPATITPIDPTIYSHRYPAVNVKRQKAWVQASLLDKPLPTTLSWPVTGFGYQNRRKGGVAPAGDDAQPRVPEPELMNIYCGAWGILSPAHPHAGSAWWRVRYLMAADAGCVLSADPHEAACLGEPYVEASDPRWVEKLSPAGLADLARRQAACLAEITWSKTRVKNALKSLIGDVRMPVRSAPTPVRPVAPVRAPGKPSAGPPPAEQGEGSGAYMRRLMTLGFQDNDTILAAVHQHFPGSKAKASDVSWNRGKLAKEGGSTPPPVAGASRQPFVPPVVRPPAPAAARRTDLPPFDGGSDPSTIVAGLAALREAIEAGGTSVMITVKGGDRTRAVDGSWLTLLMGSAR